MAKVVIFGLRDFASLAHFYLRTDSPHHVEAFCVDREYLPREEKFEGLPVIAFDEIEQHYHPDAYAFFAPMSPRQMNRLRADVYGRIKQKGYRLISYISSHATVFGNSEVGDNCFVLEQVILQPFSRIGNNTVVWAGSHIGHHSAIADHVSITAHVVISGHCIVEPYTFLGVNATVRDGIRLAEGTFVAMAAGVTKDTEAWSVYKGNPAQKSNVSSLNVEP